MDCQTFEVYGDDMPGFNEIKAAAMSKWGSGRGSYGYSRLKNKWVEKVQNAIKIKNIYSIDKIFLNMLWIEKTKRRDPDNIAVFIKFILDGLQKSNIIKNDGWNQVIGWENEFTIGEKRGVQVKIYDAETL